MALRFALLLVMLLAGCRVSPSVDMDALSSTIDRIAGSDSDVVVAVSIRDPLSGTRFDRNGDRLYHAASTMKIPVLIELYRRAAIGELSLDDSLEVVNSFRSIVDGSQFSIGDDSDDAIYELLGTQMAISDLAFNMITISSNLATNLLIDYLGAEAVQSTSEAIGTTRMETLRGVEDLKAFELGMSNRTTSSDLALLLERLLHGRAVGAEEDDAMIEVLSAQLMNEMIPAGLPAGTRIAHKTGQITAIHHDAAIIYPEDGQPYVLVILIEGIADDTVSATLGANVAAAVHRALRPAA